MDGLTQMRRDSAAVVDLIGIRIATEVERVAFQSGRGQFPLSPQRLGHRKDRRRIEAATDFAGDRVAGT